MSTTGQLCDWERKRENHKKIRPTDVMFDVSKYCRTLLNLYDILQHDENMVNYLLRPTLLSSVRLCFEEHQIVAQFASSVPECQHGPLIFSLSVFLRARTDVRFIVYKIT